MRYFDLASWWARHLVAGFVTFAGTVLAWFVVWSLVCIPLGLVGAISPWVYLQGLWLVFVGLVPSLFMVVPCVILAERLTSPVGVFRYVAQIPIVLGVTLMGVFTLGVIGLLVNWLLLPGFMGYVGVCLVMALPISVGYWLSCKAIEFGLESVGEVLAMIGAGIKGSADLYQYVQAWRAQRRVPTNPGLADTLGTTPLPGPEARGR